MKLNIHHHYPADPRVDTILELLKTQGKEVKQIMADLSKLATAFSTFAADFGQFKTDLTAFLGTLPKPEDPAVQAQIDGFTQTLTDMDSSVQSMDQSLKA